jgi:hypothetical protein
MNGEIAAILAMDGIASGATSLGDTLRHTQSGNTRSYAVWVVIGAILVFGIIFWPVFRPAIGALREGRLP